jgi:hypothetical protein
LEAKVQCVNCHEEITDWTKIEVAKDPQGNEYWSCSKGCQRVFIYCAAHLANLVGIERYTIN